MIKKVVLKRNMRTSYYKGRPQGGFTADYKVFAKYIAENGNAVCAINDEIVEPSKGNEIYRELKASGAKCTERETIEASDSEMLDMIESRVDRHVEYIEDYKQYRAACERNDRLYRLAAEFRRVAER